METESPRSLVRIINSPSRPVAGVLLKHIADEVGFKSRWMLILIGHQTLVPGLSTTETTVLSA